MTEKLGLAFSGGGFRASFYHIGVLAQMAEQGLLRHVEVISTVSGGSIIGALYYLHVKKLLESKADAEITDLDYVKIVQKIEVDFLKATENNIRMELFSDLQANYKMISATYSSSDRLADLYNKHLYQSVLSASEDVSNPVQMQELKIYPDGNKNFIPREGNAMRKAKVPILVLNATTLNTGQNWQFTAKTMGEYPTEKGVPPFDRIDKKSIRLRRADSYSDITDVKNKEGLSLQNISLGHAVAASACVPGLFHPMSITGLYKDKLANDESIIPQLVDGGVFDNQAIEGLLQNECNCFVISDAAGQMGVENEPATGAIPVLLRVSSILQNRVRSESLGHLLTRTGKANVAFMDLRRGIKIREIAWVDNAGSQVSDNWIKEDGTETTDEIEAASSKIFNVDAKVQEKLCLVRTDLDAFTEVEAYSLMLDGYRMTGNELPSLNFAANHAVINKASWKFNEIASWMDDKSQKDKTDYLYQLEVAEMVPFKALKLLPFQLGVPLVLTICTVIYLWHAQIIAFLFHQFTIFALLIAIAGWGLNAVAPTLVKAFKFLNYLRRPAQFTKRFAVVVWLMLGTLFFKFYLKFINPMFLARGRVVNLK